VLLDHQLVPRMADCTRLSSSTPTLQMLQGKSWRARSPLLPALCRLHCHARPPFKAAPQRAPGTPSSGPAAATVLTGDMPGRRSSKRQLVMMRAGSAVTGGSMRGRQLISPPLMMSGCSSQQRWHTRAPCCWSGHGQVRACAFFVAASTQPTSQTSSFHYRLHQRTQHQTDLLPSPHINRLHSLAPCNVPPNARPRRQPQRPSPQKPVAAPPCKRWPSLQQLEPSPTHLAAAAACSAATNHPDQQHAGGRVGRDEQSQGRWFGGRD